MTDDKNFKHLVRDEARRQGRTYTDVRAELRPPGQAAAEVPPPEPAAVAERFEAIIAAIERWIYGKSDTVRLVATALVVPGNVLCTGVAGNGMTALGLGVAAAIGGQLVSIDGRTGFEPAETARWRPDDVVLISNFDGLDPAAQVAIVEAGHVPAIVLAKRHPIEGRMPHPPDDDTRERFLFGVEFGYVDADTELRILQEARDGSAGDGSLGPAVDVGGLAAMRAAAAAVDVPDDVRRFVVDAVAATRRDASLLLGASTVATLALVRATAAASITSGRTRATIADARAMLDPVLSHRLVFAPGAAP
jgi:MoxR-like ATPase